MQSPYANSASTRSKLVNCGADVSSMRDIKCVVVGNKGVGKTSLLMAQTMNLCVSEFIPRTLNNCIFNISVNGKQVPLHLLDTFERQGEYNYYGSFRSQYPHTDVIILCFSLVSPVSFEDVYRKWYPEVKECCPSSPIILVGTKLDLRSNPEVIESLKKENCAPITTTDGLALAKMIGSWKYVECSTSEIERVKRVFMEAAHAAGR